MLVTRIPVEDKDLVNTPNWKALFEVTKGNESGNFRMETDPKTNEGLLYVIKVNGFEGIQIIVCTGSYFAEASENNLFGKIQTPDVFDESIEMLLNLPFVSTF